MRVAPDARGPNAPEARGPNAPEARGPSAPEAPPEAHGGLVLRADSVSKRFVLHLQGGLALPVLADISLDVHAGECVALSGPSGAGKSTLLRCLAGNYGAESGRIMVRHRGSWVDLVEADPRALRALRRDTVAHVSQFLRAIPRVPARALVAEPLRELGVASEAAQARATAMLRRLNLPDRLHDLPPATFSGGEQQRVNLARGFVRGAPLLLLDEPTASLDAGNRDVVIGLIQEAKAAGAAVVGIFHDAAVRERVADRTFEVLPRPGP